MRKIGGISQLALLCSVGALALNFGPTARADTIETIDPNSANYDTYMNVSDLPPPNGDGAYQFGSSWGMADLSAAFTASTVTLEAADVPGDNSSYWYSQPAGPGATGQKQMDANLYKEVDDGSLANQTVTFTGTVLSNTLISPYTSVAFIKDFNSGFGLVSSVTAPLTPGTFNISLLTTPNATDHIQYGFETIGPDVYPGDNPTKGSVVLSVPEPATLGLIALAAPLILRRRRA